jgi:hypothetical protein
MSAAKMEIASNQLTKNQLKTIRKYKNRLAKKLPNFHIAWVKPLKKNMIEAHLESDKWTYRKGLQAVKLAIEVEDETGVFIFLR